MILKLYPSLMFFWWCYVCTAAILLLCHVEAFTFDSRTTTTSTAVDKNNKFFIYYDSSNNLHRDISFHYENPERITVCIEALYKYAATSTTGNIQSKIELIDIAPVTTTYQSLLTNVEQIPSLQHKPVLDDEIQYARNLFLQTHLSDLVVQIEDKCIRSQEQRIKDGKGPSLGYIGYLDGGDTYLTTETFNVCIRAMIAWIRAANVCLLSSSSSSSTCFAMACTRPPGHHATYDLQNGFCLYNFAAATAIHALVSSSSSNTAVTKVSILDWDVHYGQGIADIVKSSKYRNSIRYVSIHQTPAFPYEGERNQCVDNVMTLPIPPETTWACGYSNIYEKAIKFCYNLFDTQEGEWDADLIIICAGYDALSNDELAGVNLDAIDYYQMVQRLCQYIDETIQSYNHKNPNVPSMKKKPKIMLGLEGGYKLNDAGSSGNLPDAVVATVKSFLEQTYI